MADKGSSIESATQYLQYRSKGSTAAKAVPQQRQYRSEK
jgi:hypothetical protein